MLILSIAAAGFAGAVARFWLAGRGPASFPWWVLFINVSGAFALGLLAGLPDLSASVRVPLGAGFLGAYTTFSTWMLDTVRLSRRRALANLLLSTVTGLAAAAAGLAIARWLA